MKVNDAVIYKGRWHRVIRGAPIRHDERQVVVERVRGRTCLTESELQNG